MNFNQFQQQILKLPPATFEDFVADIMREGGVFEDVRQHVITDGIEVDIVAKEKEIGLIGKPTLLVEVKSAKLISADIVRALATRAIALSYFYPTPARFVLVIAGSMTESAIVAAKSEGLEVWDSFTLSKLCPASVAKTFLGDSLSGGPADVVRSIGILADTLKAVPKGHTGFVAYQEIVSEIFEHLFCPPLESPRYEYYDEAEKNRRDMIFENSASDGFWARLRAAYSAHYIVVDAKNHEGAIGKDETLRLAHYLKPYGCGLFGILVCRNGASPACRHAIKEQWIAAQKMILIIDDEHLLEMLRIKNHGGRPEEIIRSLLAEFRMRL